MALLFNFITQCYSNNIPDSENNFLRLLYYARNEQEAFDGFQKLKRKYSKEFECLKNNIDAETQKNCLKSVIENKKVIKKEYLNKLKSYKNKAIHDSARFMNSFLLRHYSRVLLNKIENLEKKINEF